MLFFSGFARTFFFFWELGINLAEFSSIIYTREDGDQPGPHASGMSPNPEHNERGVMGGFIGQAASLCN